MPLHTVAQCELVLLRKLPYEHNTEFQQIVGFLNNRLF